MSRKKDATPKEPAKERQGLRMNSCTFERVAEEAAERSTTDENQALVAILFSVSMLEGFLAELVAFATEFPGLPQSPQTRTLASLLTEDDIQRVPLTTRLHLAHVAFVGEPLPQDGLLLQDFNRLVTLRDNLAHPKADWSTRTSPDSVQGFKGRNLQRVVAELAARGIAQKIPPMATTALIPAICTPKVARWALETARGVRAAVLDAGEGTSAVASAYRGTLQQDTIHREQVRQFKALLNGGG